MQPKDIVTIVISSLALLVALGSVLYTIYRGRYEERRTLRNLLTDAFKEMTSVYIEMVQLSPETDILAMLNQYYMTLLDQAMYLADKVKSLVTPVEYNTLAYSNLNIGRAIKAQEYYLKAIEICPSSSSFRPPAIMSYASFLFLQRQFETGQEQYNKALALLTGGDNQTRLVRGQIYQIWAVNERNLAHAKRRADELFDRAENEFKGIDFEVIRQKALESLEKAKATPTQPVTPTPPLNVPPLPPTPPSSS